MVTKLAASWLSKWSEFALNYCKITTNTFKQQLWRSIILYRVIRELNDLQNWKLKILNLGRILECLQDPQIITLAANLNHAKTGTDLFKLPEVDIESELSQI